METLESIAQTLSDELDGYTDTATVELPGGFSVRARMLSDDLSWQDMTDPEVVGTIEEGSRYDGSRPSGFDGAARKLTSRSGPLWWQPPADVVNDPAILEAAFQYVQGYFLESWTHIVLRVEVFRNGREIGCDVLGGVESNATDYIRDELLPEMMEGAGLDLELIARLERWPELACLVVN